MMHPQNALLVAYCLSAGNQTVTTQASPVELLPQSPMRSQHC